MFKLAVLLTALLITPAFAQEAKPPEPQKIEEVSCPQMEVAVEVLTKLRMSPVYRGVNASDKTPFFLWISADNKLMALMMILVKPEKEPDLACVEFIKDVESNIPNLEKLWGKILGQRI